MEPVREKIRSTLPSLEEEQIETLVTKLTDIGVTNLEDCTFLTAADFDGILSLIQSRRLINAFSSASQSTLVVSGAPSEHLVGTPTVVLNEHLVGTPSATPPQKFQIPWQKFPVTLMNALKEKKRPPPKDRRHMIRIIMEDMMATDTRPGRSKLKQVA
ncbi:uncharacterized protein LOC118495660 isoform X1 [Sander lucioperca]|uniref:uncharacterized protein LOC118495660 isoform X1 n=1 Tax=Sander lucioperca TaxID=283035 RepID=UPI001653E062|nr:uncharacterized protein LOC118495660 isoform X1 [Sander lucioperca]